MPEAPRIVFIDSHTVDLGDLDMSALMRLGSYRTQPLHRAGKAEIIISNKIEIGAAELKRLSRLRLICVAATGVNNVDLKAAQRRAVAITNVAGYSTTTVAEQTLLFMLACGHRLLEHHQAAVSSQWSRSKTFAVLKYPYSDLGGKTLGIIGYGAIGRRVARLARAIGMNILIAKLPARHYARSPKRHSLSDVLKKSDFVSLHCPLTETTHHLINARALKQMKRSAYLLNLARGPIVSERAVASALRRNELAGYAADVLSEEPPPPKHPLLQKGVKEKVLLSPHIAWASQESRQRLIDEIAKNIAAFLKGRKRNRIV